MSNTHHETYDCVDCGKPLIRKDRVILKDDQKPPQRCGTCFLKDARNWRCQCGQTPEMAGGYWRWNGEVWQHHHGYPIGHVDAKRKEPMNTTATKARISKITVGRLFNLGSYEHVRYELCVEVPEGSSASQALIGVEKILEGLNPAALRVCSSEQDLKREVARIEEAEKLTDEQFKSPNRYGGYEGTRAEILQRLRKGYKEMKERREKLLEIARTARKLLDDLGGASQYKDAKLSWGYDDDEPADL